MPDQLTRAEAARRNGARTHGLTARDLSLTPAEQEIYGAHFTSLVEIWNPTRSYELFLVSRLAPEIASTFEVIDETGALALGFRSLNDKSTAHTNLDRHLARLSREAPIRNNPEFANEPDAADAGSLPAAATPEAHS